MNLLVLILLAAVFYTLFDVFSARAGGKIDANLSAVIFNLLGTLIPLVLFSYLKAAKSSLLPTSKEGVVYSVLAGVSIAAFSVLLIKVFEKGGLSYVMPLIYGASIVLASIIGWAFFKEEVALMQWIGIFVVAVGIVIIIVAKAQA